MESNEQQIISENEWIEQELFRPGSVENNIWVSGAPKRDLITRWAENLEKLHEAGKFHQDINTISTYISNKLREHKMFTAVHYVSETLDYKYKNPIQSANRSGVEEPQEISSNLLSFEATQSNQTLITHLTRTIERLKSNVDRLKSDVFLESKIPELEQEQLYLNWDHIIKRNQEAFDGREKVLTSHQHLVAYALSNFSLNHMYVEYVKYAKDDTKLTEKQASKMSRLQTNKIDPLFDPINFMEAKELGFRGQQCPTCGSWRTEKKYNPDNTTDMLFCYSIHKDSDKSQYTVLKTMKLEEVIIEH